MRNLHLNRLLPLAGICILFLLIGCTSKSLHAEIPVDPAVEIEITPDLKVRHIQKGVFVFTHVFPWEANSLAVVMGEHLVLVDTPWTPAATQEMLDWLDETLGPRKILAINTHFHLDNLGGNETLIQQGIPVYGSATTVELLATRGTAMLEQTLTWLEGSEDPRFAAELSDLKLTPPDHVFNLDDGFKLIFDGETVQGYFPGPGHSPDNLVVFFPERKLLFGGCLIIGWDDIGNTSDADLAAWPESVQGLSQFDFEILIPGHGSRLDPALLAHTLELLISAE